VDIITGNYRQKSQRLLRVARNYNPGDPALLVLYLGDESLESKSYAT